MQTLLKLEETAEFLLGIILFSLLNYSWWIFPALLFVPDISMVGYLFNNRIGAWCYNFVHHKGIAIVLYISGIWMGDPLLQLAGVILFAHAAFDRIFGYGFKYADSFRHTHLGWIGVKNGRA